MPRDPVQLPARLARLVQKANGADLSRDMALQIGPEKRTVTIGLGPGVDIPLLNQQLYAAEIALLDRELVVASIRAEPDGYVIERGWSSFGVYTWSESNPGWTSVPHRGFVRGLRPGDRVALGSAPADALTFLLPASDLVPAPADRLGLTAATPPPFGTGPGDPPPTLDPDLGISQGSQPSLSRQSRSGSRSGSHRLPAPPRALPPAQRGQYQAEFDYALRYWNYELITFGSAPDCVIVVDDPRLQGFRASLGRSIVEPELGYQIHVQHPGPEFWVKARGEAVRYLYEQDAVRLRGGGHRMGFHGYVVELPEPMVPQARFTSADQPTDVDIAEALEVTVDRLSDVRLVKARYLAYQRAFSDNEAELDPGDLSRFDELRWCFAAWMNRYGST